MQNPDPRAKYRDDSTGTGWDKEPLLPNQLMQYPMLSASGIAWAQAAADNCSYFLTLA